LHGLQAGTILKQDYVKVSRAARSVRHQLTDAFASRLERFQDLDLAHVFAVLMTVHLNMFSMFVIAYNFDNENLFHYLVEAVMDGAEATSIDFFT
jgi:hypothetical protein